MENSGVMSPLTKRWRNDFTAGGARRDMAIARMSLGASVLAAVDQLHNEGVITGDGPENKALIPVLKSSGWQANSWRMGDDYLSYNRMDPMGMMVGSMANALDALKYSDNEEDKTMIAMQLLLGISENLTNKTYMQGISELLTAVSGKYGPVQGASNMVTSTAASFVPSWLNSAARAQDPQQRISGYGASPTSEGMWQSFITKAKGRTPWMRQDLPLRYDWKGDVTISDTEGWENGLVPFSRTKGKRDVVTEVLIMSQVPVKKPKPMLSFGTGTEQVDLRDLDHQVGMVYAKYQEIVGKGRYASLSDLIPSNADITKFTPSDAVAEEIRSTVAKGTRAGKKDFIEWYVTEAPNHGEWIQPGSDEFQAILHKPETDEAPGQNRLPPHLTASTPPGF